MNKATHLLLGLLASLLVLSSGQEPNATLSTVTINPCSNTTFETVSLYKSDIYTVVNNVSLCGDSWNPNTTNVSIYLSSRDRAHINVTLLIFTANCFISSYSNWCVVFVLCVPSSVQGFRVYTYAEGNNLTHTPVVFVVRQDKDGVLSWTIPLRPLGSAIVFSGTVAVYVLHTNVQPLSGHVT